MAAAFLDTVECRSHAKVLQALARHGYNRASHGSGTHPEQVAYGYKPAPIAYGYNVTTQAHGHNPRLPPDYGHAVPPPPSFAMRDHPPQHGPHNPHG